MNAAASPTRHEGDAHAGIAARNAALPRRSLTRSGCGAAA